MASTRDQPYADDDDDRRSTRSSPRAGSDIYDPASEHQREQDVHLATSMIPQSNFVRNRSNTLIERTSGSAEQSGSMQTPQRQAVSPSTTTGGEGVLNSAQQRTTQGDRDSHHHHHHHSSISRRRGSTAAATNAMDHLADDLEISAHQDRRFDSELGSAGPTATSQQAQMSSSGPIGASGNSTAGQERPGPGIMRYSAGGSTSTPQQTTPASVMHSSAAMRFYRQQRNLSESSIDSQGGAFIDHRRQPMSLAPTHMITPRNGNIGSSNLAASRSPENFAGRSPGNVNTSRLSADGRHDSMDDITLGPSASGVNGSRSPASPRAGANPTDSGISTHTTRPGHYSTRDLDEHAIEDDDEQDTRFSPRQQLERHHSHRSYHTLTGNPDHPDNNDQHARHGSYSNQLSRQGSFSGPPEDDICFPAHGADVNLIDMGFDERMHHGEHAGGVPGLLHNYSIPFDFSLLEEYAEKEREGMPIPGARKRTTRGGNAAAHSSGVSPPGYGTSTATARFGMSSSGEGGEGRRMGRHRKLSESVAPGRYRRKLALFEGGAAGNEEGGVGGPPGQPEGPNGHFTTILDTKTPLLDKNLPNGVGSGGYGAATGGQSGGARPYRFSFYSNALPSTIHARSLAEIPGEGQTFEELFSGRKPNPLEDDPTYGNGNVQDHRGPMSPPSGHGTGVNTPSANGTHLHGASLTSSRAQTGAGLSQAEARARAERARTSLIRSDVDAEANTWWLDVMCPTDSEMKVLSKVFGIHPLTTEDIQMEETREKIELFRNYYFVCFRSFEQDPYSPTYLEPLNMYIIVFREGTLSFHFRGTPHPQNVRRRIKQLKDYINVTSDWISYALIDDITDAFGPLIQNIEYEVDSIDELVLILKEAEQSDMLRRIGTCRKKVMGLLRLMGNKADVVKGLSKRCNENWSVAPKSDIGLYLSDIQDHITTSTQNLTHYEKILSRSHSNYLAQISIEMTDANNQINDVLSKLTALGTVLIPMNLVTGLWGMNVKVPGEGIENLHWFAGIVGCLAAFAVGGAWLTYRSISSISSASAVRALLLARVWSIAPVANAATSPASLAITLTAPLQPAIVFFWQGAWNNQSTSDLGPKAIPQCSTQLIELLPNTGSPVQAVLPVSLTVAPVGLAPYGMFGTYGDPYGAVGNEIGPRDGFQWVADLPVGTNFSMALSDYRNNSGGAVDNFYITEGFDNCTVRSASDQGAMALDISPQDTPCDAILVGVQGGQRPYKVTVMSGMSGLFGNTTLVGDSEIALRNVVPAGQRFTHYDSQADGGGPSLGAIVGGAVGGLAAAIALAFLAWWFLRRRTRKANERYQAQEELVTKSEYKMADGKTPLVTPFVMPRHQGSDYDDASSPTSAHPSLSSPQDNPYGVDTMAGGPMYGHPPISTSNYPPSGPSPISGASRHHMYPTDSSAPSSYPTYDDDDQDSPSQYRSAVTVDGLADPAEFAFREPGTWTSSGQASTSAPAPTNDDPTTITLGQPRRLPPGAGQY
ncbi:CorA metal ion transporter [Microbotryomycetes sp. JL221]|nr:CorA metal ion transporter [Microbotryomycetes sp. JL221]